MEYLQKKEYFPFKTVIIDDSLSLQNHPTRKKMPGVIWNLFHFILGQLYSLLHEAS